MNTKRPPKLTPRKWIGLLCAAVAVGCFAWLGCYAVAQANARARYAQLQEIAYSADTMSSVSTPAEPEDAESVPTVEIPIDFAALQQQNPDIYAWITVPGTEIDDPLLQNAQETDYYLYYTVDRVKGLPGALYTRNDTPQDFSAPCSIVYGHNMEDDKTMFSTLHRFESEDFFKDAANRTILVYTPDRLLEYQIFAAVRYSDVLLTAAFDFNAEDGAGTQAFVEALRNATGFFDGDVTLPDNPRLLVLSTCMDLRANAANERWLVVGVLANEWMAAA